MPVNCEIKFDNNPQGIFFAGQTLAGTVELTLDKPKKIKAVSLKVEGFAKSTWYDKETTKDSDGKTTKSKVKYEGREEYLNATIYLIGSAEGTQIEILPGIHTYNFRTVLPSSLPTSIEGKYGYIRYTVRVALEVPWESDLTYKEGFTVLKQLDLNYDSPTLRIPAKMEEFKTYYCGICETDPLYLSASVPMTGFVAGQIIKITIEINNKSSVDVEDLKVSLKKCIVYRSQTPRLSTKSEESVEQEIHCGKIIRNFNTRFLQNISIPAVPPTNQCQVLNVSYEVQVVAKMQTFFDGPMVAIPITIGTVPLMFSSTYPTTPGYMAQSVTIPAVPTTQTPIVDAIASAMSQTTQSQQNRQNNTNELPPPTYEEAVSGGVLVDTEENSQNAMGHKIYHPRYPVYKFDASAGFRVLPGSSGISQTTDL